MSKSFHEFPRKSFENTKNEFERMGKFQHTHVISYEINVCQAVSAYAFQIHLEIHALMQSDKKNTAIFFGNGLRYHLLEKFKVKGNFKLKLQSN